MTGVEMSIFRLRRLGTKLNALTIVLVLMSAAGSTGFVIARGVQLQYDQLASHGQALAALAGHNSEYAIYSEDEQALSQVIDSLRDERDVAYVALLDANHRTLAERTILPAFDRPPTNTSLNGEGAAPVVLEGRNAADVSYFDIVWPVVNDPAASVIGGLFPDETRKQQVRVVGYVQIGLSHERLHQNVHDFIISSVTVTAFILAVGVILSWSLTGCAVVGC